MKYPKTGYTFDLKCSRCNRVSYLGSPSPEPLPHIPCPYCLDIELTVTRVAPANADQKMYRVVISLDIEAYDEEDVARVVENEIGDDSMTIEAVTEKEQAR